MRTLLAITSAISDLNRIRILCALSCGGELCVCQIHELLGLAPSTTSKHLSLLANAGLVEMRKQGRWAYYRLSQEPPPHEARELLTWLCREANQSPVIAEDCQKLRVILNFTPEALCQMQSQGIACCSFVPETPAEAKSPKDGCGC